MTEDDDGIVAEFLAESHESLVELDGLLDSFASTSAGGDELRTFFRALHTIKGTCGFLGFPVLESISHRGEELLSTLRDGTAEVSAEVVEVLGALLDAIRELLGHIERDGGEGSGDYRALLESLDALGRGVADPAAVGSPRAEEGSGGAPLSASAPTGAPATAGAAATPRKAAGPTGADPTIGASSPPGVPDGREPAVAHLVESNVRVEVGLLDKLMNAVGELVLTRNEFLALAPGRDDPGFAGAIARLSQITTELHAGVVQTRMQPIEGAWARLPRLAREVARACGKEVHLELEGWEVELDRTVIEAIRDPLTHLVRNAIDHGLEAPEQRAALGKARAGRVSLHAFHEGGQVHVEVSDDGAGIDLARVREKAVARGLLSAQRAADCSDREAGALIFEPGLSTAEHATSVSGRGVGMDVVRTNIERIGGSVELSSERGNGTTFRLRIPLTLAIIPALVVGSGATRYAIPQVNLLEVARVAPESAGVLADVAGAPTYRWRGNLLPLLDLAAMLAGAAPARSVERREPLDVVVLQGAESRFALVVDGVHDTEEIVVKPLHPAVQAIGAFAGATILGDGDIVFILDAAGLARRAGVAGGSRLREARPVAAEPAANDAPPTPLLLARVGGRLDVAIALETVVRLEEYEPASVERAGSIDVVQHGGEILPLVRLSRFFGPDAPPGGQRLQVVVVEVEQRRIGLVVDELLDVCEEHVVLQHPGHDPGVLGSAVIRGRVVNLLDLGSVVRGVEPRVLAGARLRGVAS